MNLVRFGLVGAGKISQFSAEAIRKHPRARLAAVQDLSDTRANALAQEFAIPRVFQTSAELFACEEVDAVYIAAPNKFHAELAIDAMRAGKHVLLEKPFAMNAAEAAEVVSAAEETGRVFTVGMNQRFLPDAQRIAALCQAGALGEIYYAKAFWFRREGIPKLGTWFGSKTLAGAGAINDIGVHLLDLCLHAMGNFDPVSVFGATYSKFGSRGLGEGGWGLSDAANVAFDVDDLASALIRMRNGATVQLEVAWACHMGDRNRMNVELFGTDAGASMYPARLYRRAPGSEGYQIVDTIDAPPPLAHCERFHNFINRLLGEEELLVSPQQALVVQRILDAIAESCQTGKSVEL